MEFEDSRFALFPEPNAYIQKVEKNKEPKKIVFQEPYECLPNFYMNNNFTKHNCDCVSKSKENGFKDNINQHNNPLNINHDCKCNHENDVNKNHHHDNCHHSQNSSKQSGFDLKSLLPLLGLFNKSGGADLGQLVGLLNNCANSQSSNTLNPMGIISNLLSNKETMGGILNLFKGGLFNKKQPTKKELKTTDFEIKNYTRVE